MISELRQTEHKLKTDSENNDERRRKTKQQSIFKKANKEAEYEEIMSLTNPTIKKYYLEKFASSCDAAAVDLKAAALPG